MNPPKVVLKWFELLEEAYKTCQHKNIRKVLDDLADILFYDPPPADELRRFVDLYEEYQKFLEKEVK